LPALLAVLALMLPLLAACGGGTANNKPQATSAQGNTQTTPATTGGNPTAAPTTGTLLTPAGGAPTTGPQVTVAPQPTTAATATGNNPNPPAGGTVQDTVQIGMSQEPPDLLYGFGSAYVSTVVESAIYDDLVQRNNKNEYIPEIATNVPTLENGGAKLTGQGKNRQLSVTYKLRKDVKWHDGQPVTADDVVFAYNYMKNPKFPSTSAFVYREQMQDVKKNGDYEVTYTYKPGELDPTYYAVGSVMPEHILKNVPPEKYADAKANPLVDKPIGTGAYKFVSKTNERIVLQANPDYFRGAPKVKNIVFKVIPDTQALLGQLQSGDIDASTEDAHQINQFDDLQALAQRGVKAYYVPGATWEHIDLNLDLPIFKDKRVRQALMYGIDRKTITQEILRGQTKPLNTWLTPENWAYTEQGLNPYPYDPEKAGQLLDQAGVKLNEETGVREFNGQPVTLELMTTAGNDLRAQTTQFIYQNLSDLGLQVSLRYEPAAIYFGDPPEAPLSGRKFQMALYAWISGDDPGGYELYHSAQIPTKANNYEGQNYPGWRNQRNDQLLFQANRQEIERKPRLPLYAEQQKIFNDELPTLPLYQRVNITTAANGLQNWKPTPTLTPPTWNAYEWVFTK
jgi:peptide/nickel transport system substrate-binding protein